MRRNTYVQIRHTPQGYKIAMLLGFLMIVGGASLGIFLGDPNANGWNNMDLVTRIAAIMFFGGFVVILVSAVAAWLASG